MQGESAANWQAEKMGEVHGNHQGRVFNLTKEDLGIDPAVIQGMLFILETLVHALIDPGSTHSFILHALDGNVGIEVKPLGYLMIISTPMGRTKEIS